MWTKTQITPDVYFITRDWLSCNHFVARTPRLTLIDTGYKEDLGTTIEAIESIGCRIKDVELIINTHCHCDHAGGNHYIQEKSGCEVWMHEREKKRIETRDEIGTWWRFHDTWADFFRVDRGLSEGDKIRFGTMVLEVLYTPGHSAGLIALYSEQLDVLFSSDALWHGDMGVINPIVEGEDALERAMETLDRIAKLNVTTIYPGHGPIINKPEPVIKRLFKKLERYRQDPDMMHFDQLHKMISYIILTKGKMPKDGFFNYLMSSVWFPKLVDRYFDSAYKSVYKLAMDNVLKYKMVQVSKGHYYGRRKQ